MRICLSDKHKIYLSNEEESETEWFMVGREKGCEFEDISIEINLENFCSLTSDSLIQLQEWLSNNAETHMRAAMHKRDEKEAAREEMDRERRIKDRQERRARTNPGYVYLIKAENGLYKIGKARNIAARLQPFSVHFPMQWEKIHSFASENYSQAEAKLHEVFGHKRDIGEWFRLDEDDVSYILQIQDGQL